VTLPKRESPNAPGPSVSVQGGQARARLVFGLDDDAAAVLDIDVRIVAVEQPHAYEGRGVGGVCLDSDGSSIPEDRDIVDIEGHFAAIGEGRSTPAQVAQPQIRDQGRSRGQESGEAGVYYGFDFACLTGRTLNAEGDYRFIGGVYDALDHSALRRGRPPK